MHVIVNSIGDDHLCRCGCDSGGATRSLWDSLRTLTAAGAEWMPSAEPLGVESTGGVETPSSRLSACDSFFVNKKYALGFHTAPELS